MPSPVEAAGFQTVLTQLAVAAVAATRSATPNDYPDVVDPFLSAAGVLSMQWYHQLAPTARYAVQPAPTINKDALLASAHWATTRTDPAQALGLSTERRVFGTARHTVAFNARREGVKYARHASANSCSWCRILATRGPVYHSEQSGAASHDGCHCIAVPIREGDIYQPADYVTDWEADYKKARAEVGGDINDIANYMRSHPSPPSLAVEPPWQRLNQELHDKYPKTWTYFHDGDDLTTLREFRDGIDHVLQKYPQIQNRLTMVESNTGDYFRMLHPTDGDNVWAHMSPTGDHFAVVFNQTYTTNRALYLQGVQSAIDSNFHPGWDGKTGPGWQTAVHELGHGIDAMSGNATRRRAEAVLLEHFANKSTDYFNQISVRARDALNAITTQQEMFDELKRLGTQASFKQMGNFNRAALKAEGFMNEYMAELSDSGQLSRYSFHEGSNRLNAAEALAEAFSDVEANDDNASEAAHVLHALLVDSLNE